MRNERSYRASRSEYLYGSAAPAYSRGAGAEFDVIPGRRTSQGVVTLPQSIVTVAKLIVVAALVVAALCFVRVGLTAATVSTSIESDSLSAQIETARTVGGDLEVQQSQLSNSMHIRVKAASLGMAAPVDTQTIVLPADPVAVDGAGNLSLSESVSTMSNQA